jgi:hypothetical protein
MDMALGDVIARLSVHLGLETAALEKGSSRAKKEVTGLEKHVLRAGTAIKGAFVAMLGAFAIGELVRVTKAGLDYASSLGEVSQQLGVTTKALQEYRYAATQTGIEQGEMDQALSQLTRRLGDAAMGAKAPTDALKLLGITVRDANGNVRDAGETIPLIAEGLKKIHSPAERAAILVDLFGKAGQKLAPLLANGAAGVNQLRDAAHRLGLVLSEKAIQDADETADKIAELKQVLSAKISNAVAQNAAAIGVLVDQLIRLTDAASDALIAWRKWRDAAGGPNAAEENIRIQRQNRGGTPYTGSIFSVGRSGNKKPKPKGGRGGGRAFGDSRLTEAAMAPTKPSAPATAEGVANASSGKKAGGSRSSGPKGPDPLDQKFREEQEMRSLLLEEIRAREQLTTSAEERAELQRDALSLEREGRVSDIDEALRKKEITKAEAAARMEIVEKLYGQQAVYDEDTGLLIEAKQSLYGTAIWREEQEEIEKQAADTAQVQFDAQRDALRNAYDMADTQSERKALALQILDLEQQYRRNQLQMVVDSKIASKAEKDKAQAILNSLDALNAGERAAVSRSSETQAEAYLRNLRQSPEQINEAVDQIKINGLEQLNDELVNAIVNFQSLGDTAHTILQSILSDLLRLAIQRAIIAPLAGMLGLGGAGPAAAGSSLGGGLAGIPGFANGTNYTPRGLALVGERGPELIDLDPGRRIIANDELGDLMGGGQQVFKPTFVFPGITNAGQAREAGSQAARRFRQEMNGPTGV